MVVCSISVARIYFLASNNQKCPKEVVENGRRKNRYSESKRSSQKFRNPAISLRLQNDLIGIGAYCGKSRMYLRSHQGNLLTYSRETELQHCNSRSGDSSYRRKSVERKPGINERAFCRNIVRQTPAAIISFNAIQCMPYKEIASILCHTFAVYFTE